MIAIALAATLGVLVAATDLLARQRAAIHGVKGIAWTRTATGIGLVAAVAVSTLGRQWQDRAMAFALGGVVVYLAAYRWRMRTKAGRDTIG